MSAFRLSDRRLYIPGVGVIPYIRYLRLTKNGGRQYLLVKGRHVHHYFGIYGGNGKEPLMLALDALEREYGSIRTGAVLRTKERSTKLNPTGYVGVYKSSNNNLSDPYKVTCPYETNESVSSLTRAALIREQACEEYERKNTLTLGQVFAKTSSL